MMIPCRKNSPVSFPKSCLWWYTLSYASSFSKCSIKECMDKGEKMKGLPNMQKNPFTIITYSLDWSTDDSDSECSEAISSLSVGKCEPPTISMTTTDSTSSHTSLAIIAGVMVVIIIIAITIITVVVNVLKIMKHSHKDLSV